MIQPHPFSNSRLSLTAGILLTLLGIALLGGLLILYGEIPLLAAGADAGLFVGLLAVCGILSWFFFTYIRVWQAQIVMTLLVQVICLGVCYTAVSLLELEDITSFGRALPLRLAIGVLYWIVLMQGYHILQIKGEKQEQEKEEPTGILPAAAEPSEWLDRISVKDGVRIHLVRLDELHYIQACGDYVTLFTTTGQYIKEQTMKYFETQLPPAAFVRIHRSTIVSTEQITRVELFGKESYRVRLKNGTILRASGAGYKLLKERLNL
ncbi:MAG: LytTR family transcriptional regulator [Tannerellaceae bacterium]|jgi:DNA-binding LytR/AlgR family response regulator|nr:LytTR family transcriptional regulator [Tannerellaceae bacterium]